MGKGMYGTSPVQSSSLEGYCGSYEERVLQYI